METHKADPPQAHPPQADPPQAGSPNLILKDDKWQPWWEGRFIDIKCVTPDGQCNEWKDKAVEEIHGNWSKLRTILHHHETLMQKRWLKKTSKQQADILLSAWPHINRTHRSDIGIVEEWHVTTRKSRSQLFYNVQNAFLFSEFSIEDLSGEQMLILLDARARTPPCDFANPDITAIQLGRLRAPLGLYIWDFEADQPGVWKMRFAGAMTSTSYGELVRGSPYRGLFYLQREVESKDYDVQVPNFKLDFDLKDGMMILQRQVEIYGFLTRFCQKLLHEHDLDSLDEFAGKLDPSIPMTLTPGSSLLPPFVRRCRSPYHAPRQFEFSDLLDCVEIQQDRLESHIWRLHKDPIYFVQHVLERCQHTKENYKAAKAYKSAHTADPNFWQKVFNVIIQDTYWMFLMWNFLHKKLSELVDSRQRYQEGLCPGKAVPREVGEKLIEVMTLLEFMFLQYGLNLVTGITGCSSFWHLIILDKQGGVIPSARANEASGKDCDRLWTALWHLAKGLVGLDKKRPPHRLRILHFDEVERLITTNAKEKNRLSTRLLRDLTELSPLIEINRQTALSVHEGSFVENYGTGWQEKMPELEVINQTADELPRNIEGLGEFGVDLTKKFYYPSDKPASAANNAQMRDAEQQLHDFWACVDAHMLLKTGSTLHDQPCLKAILTPQVIPRTPEWKEPVTVDAKLDANSGDKAEVGKDVPDPKAALFELEYLSQLTVKDDKPIERKKKEKTKGKPNQKKRRQ